jgi:T-complex protein 1 subunit theta
VTSDAATIIREIEVVHPAAKLLVMASQAQESEVCVVIDLWGLMFMMFGLDGRCYKYGSHSSWRTVEKG